MINFKEHSSSNKIINCYTLGTYNQFIIVYLYEITNMHIHINLSGINLFIIVFSR